MILTNQCGAKVSLATWRWRHPAVGMLAATAMVAATVVVTAAPSEAACSGVSSPRLRYWCGTVQPSTAYSDRSTVGKNYNSMNQGGSLPVGIYYQSPSTGVKTNSVSGTGYVYQQTSRTTSHAYCWNRSSSVTASANCDYDKN